MRIGRGFVRFAHLRRASTITFPSRRSPSERNASQTDRFRTVPQASIQHTARFFRHLGHCVIASDSPMAICRIPLFER